MLHESYRRIYDRTACEGYYITNDDNDCDEPCGDVGKPGIRMRFTCASMVGGSVTQELDLPELVHGCRNISSLGKATVAEAEKELCKLLRGCESSWRIILLDVDDVRLRVIMAMATDDDDEMDEHVQFSFSSKKWAAYFRIEVDRDDGTIDRYNIKAGNRMRVEELVPKRESGSIIDDKSDWRDLFVKRSLGFYPFSWPQTFECTSLFVACIHEHH